MAQPAHIKTIIVEMNVTNINVLQDALMNYHKYLQDVLQYEHQIPLSKSAIKRRISYIEDFLERIEL